jgi:hypothetical protein
MEREMNERMKRMIAAVLCHRAMCGIAMTVYWGQAQGMLSKEAAGYALFAVYVVLFARDGR